MAWLYGILGVLGLIVCGLAIAAYGAKPPGLAAAIVGFVVCMWLATTFRHSPLGVVAAFIPWGFIVWGWAADFTLKRYQERFGDIDEQRDRRRLVLLFTLWLSQHPELMRDFHDWCDEHQDTFSDKY